MFKLNLNRTIQTLVDHELDRDTSIKILDNNNFQRPGVYLSVILRVSDDNLNKTEYKKICMLFMGSTSVFYAIKDKFNHIKKIPNEAWRNTSNHDSCWRGDGFAFLHEIQMEMCKRVNPNIVPIKLYTDARLSIGFSYPIKKCLVTYKINTDDDYGYKIVKIDVID